jgi:hypothetical protein
MKIRKAGQPDPLFRCPIYNMSFVKYRYFLEYGNACWTVAPSRSTYPPIAEIAFEA